MPRKLFLCFLICLLLSAQGLAPARAAAPAFVLSTASKAASVGQDIRITLQGQELVDVYAYDVTLSFDSTKLRFKEAASSISGLSTDPIRSDGQIRFAHTKIGQTAGIGGSAILAEFSFQAIGAGKSEVAVKELKLVDSKLNMTSLHPTARMSVEIVNATGYLDLGAKWSWAAEAIGELTKQGVVNGTGNGKFEPERGVKRGDLMVMLARAFGLKAQADGGSFADVPQGRYYSDAIAAAKTLGIATGDGAGFKPEAAVSRQDLMVLIDRTLRALEKALPEPAGTELNGFADQDLVADYAKRSVATLVKAGIVKGGADGIEPAKGANRAETAVILYRILKLQQP